MSAPRTCCLAKLLQSAELICDCQGSEGVMILFFFDGCVRESLAKGSPHRSAQAAHYSAGAADGSHRLAGTR